MISKENFAVIGQYAREIALTDDEKLLAVGSFETHIEIWNMETFRILNTFSVPYSSGVGRLAFLKSSQTLAVLDYNTQKCTIIEPKKLPVTFQFLLPHEPDNLIAWGPSSFFINYDGGKHFQVTLKNKDINMSSTYEGRVLFADQDLKIVTSPNNDIWEENFDGTKNRIFESRPFPAISISLNHEGLVVGYNDGTLLYRSSTGQFCSFFLRKDFLPIETFLTRDSVLAIFRDVNVIKPCKLYRLSCVSGDLEIEHEQDLDEGTSYKFLPKRGLLVSTDGNLFRI